jgi:hypothetical protein
MPEPEASCEKAPLLGCSWPGVDEYSGKRCILMDEHDGCHRVDPPLVGSSAWDEPWWRDFAAAHPENSWVRHQAEWTAKNAAPEATSGASIGPSAVPSGAVVSGGSAP